MNARIFIDTNLLIYALCCLSLKTRYQYSYWDSLILASALESRCQIVYSEDMQDGQQIEHTLTIQNPFKSRP
jgi:predicted nucleic acid-binding protein